MQLKIDEARKLGAEALVRCGMSEYSALQVADHLIEAALCGHEFSSLPRLIAIAEELRSRAPAAAIRVTREDGCFASIDGGDNIAYVVSLVAIDKGIEICRRTGVAVVTARNTWFSGRLAYYVERAARLGFVALHTTNTTARVAPYGGTERLMGTNPFAVAFPSCDDPLVIDIGTSAITWGDVVLSRTKGEPLPEGVAVGPDGKPTCDPAAALEGAFLPWGGQRGSALSIAIQLLGVLAGSPAVIQDSHDFGLFFVLIDPRRIIPDGSFEAQVSAMRRAILANRPVVSGEPVHVPGDGSQARRARALAKGEIYLDDRVYERIRTLAQ
ncbi:MAG: Ldh family oxidoreductase [Betaproteobacteria bacterium]|nr:MAG: Ldh family oxidoreductase [Betaproteobacteria bacterium]